MSRLASDGLDSALQTFYWVMVLMWSWITLQFPCVVWPQLFPGRRAVLLFPLAAETSYSGFRSEKVFTEMLHGKISFFISLCEDLQTRVSLDTLLCVYFYTEYEGMFTWLIQVCIRSAFYLCNCIIIKFWSNLLNLLMCPIQLSLSYY